jgi:hypothetical protein
MTCGFGTGFGQKRTTGTSRDVYRRLVIERLNSVLSKQALD